MIRTQKVIQLLDETLQPSLTNRSQQQLNQLKGYSGFVTELLLTVDNDNLSINIRQSALVYIKNMVMDHTEKGEIINNEDLHILKSSILDALIRSTKYKKSMLPTFNQIVYLLAKKYYPQQWSNFVEPIINHLGSSQNFSIIFGSVQALRAIFSVFGKSIMQQISLNNLCNRTVLPLLNLASKLFQNYNEQTGQILISIFKIFNTAIYFYIPESIKLNLHSLMIFLKKILDLSLNNSHSMYILKKICLRTLFRIYQRHINSKLQTHQKQFILTFHQKYTKSLVETFLLQIMNYSVDHKKMYLTKLSLSCLAYIYRDHRSSAQLIDQYRDKLLYLCINSYKSHSLTRVYQSLPQYRTHIHQERIHLKQMLFSLFNNDTNPEGQDQSVRMILGLLFDCIQKGDIQIKQLCLYIFGSMATQIRYLQRSIDDQMIQFVLMYVKPLLLPNQHTIIRCRACQLVQSYQYLQLPPNELLQLAQAVYQCLLFNNGQQNSFFLQVYAAQAYTTLLKHESVIKISINHIQNILQIYTKLLQIDISIMCSIEKLLTCLDQHIKQYSIGLITLFIQMFIKYSAKVNNGQQINNTNSNLNFNNTQNNNYPDEQEDEEDNLSQDESQCDNNYESAAKACLACIRQLLQSSELKLNQQIYTMLWQILMRIMSDNEQLYIEQGFNILNLIIYQSSPLPCIYYNFLLVIIYAIEGISNPLLDKLSGSTNINQQQLLCLIKNLCINVDNDIIENVIGCLRNYLHKIPVDYLRIQMDCLSITYMEHFVRIVRIVHENQQGKHHRSDRMLILMIYLTMIEEKIVNQKELEVIIGDVYRWMKMEKQAARYKQQNQKQLQNYKHTYLTYSPFYLQILYVSIWCYPQLIFSWINIDQLIQLTLQIKHKLTCDYQINRVLIGLCTILNLHKLGNKQLVYQIMTSLPAMVKIVYQSRNQNKSLSQDMSEQAEEQKLFGQDENTHMIGWKNNDNNIVNNGNNKCVEQSQQSDCDWQQQYNKFYISSLDQIDELKILSNVLSNSNEYIQCLNIQQQEQLSHYILNTMPKTENP